MDLGLIERKWDEGRSRQQRRGRRSYDWLTFWRDLISQPSRQFFEAVRCEVGRKSMLRLKAWLRGPEYGAIMAYADAEGGFVPLEPFFRAHLTSALGLLDYRNQSHWPSRSLTQRLQARLDEAQRTAPALRRYVGLPMLRDLAAMLSGEPRREPDHTVIAPFALVPKTGSGEAALAQFRLARLPCDSDAGQADGIGPGQEGDVYLDPEQAFLRMDRRFHESVFDTANRAVKRLLEHTDAATARCDVRVRIEEFDAENQRPSTGLFDPEGRGARSVLLGSKELTGRSAGGAAAWGLYFLLTGKRPDPGLIVLAQVDGTGEVCSLEDEANGQAGLPAKLLGSKVRKIAASGLFDTIAVVGEANKRDAEEALAEMIGRKAIPQAAMVVRNIEEVETNNAGSD